MNEMFQWHEACCRVIRAAERAGPHSTLEYAASYARGGKDMTSREAIRAQVPYILNNLQYWRGAEAHEVKDILRRFA